MLKLNSYSVSNSKLKGLGTSGIKHIHTGLFSTLTMNLALVFSLFALNNNNLQFYRDPLIVICTVSRLNFYRSPHCDKFLTYPVQSTGGVLYIVMTVYVTASFCVSCSLVMSKVDSDIDVRS